MALVPSKLIGNRIKEWNQFVDVNDTLLNFKLLIGHSQARSDKILIGHIWDGLATDRNSSPAKTATSFLVITTPGSYQSNVAKTLKQTFYSNYIPIRKIRTVYRQESEQRDMWRQIYLDKYHKEKRVSTVEMDICWNARNKNKECQVWFVLGTPWAKSLHNLQGVFEVLSSLSWEHHPALKVAMGEQYGRLISGYEVLLNRIEFIPSQLNNNSPIRTMAEILETQIIQCTGDSN